MPEALSENEHIADILERVAGLLELKKESRYRIRSYRRAAEAIRDAERPVAEALRERWAGLGYAVEDTAEGPRWRRG